jgi:hypothetical protein
MLAAISALSYARSLARRHLPREVDEDSFVAIIHLGHVAAQARHVGIISRPRFAALRRKVRATHPKIESFLGSIEKLFREPDGSHHDQKI